MVVCAHIYIFGIIIIITITIIIIIVVVVVTISKLGSAQCLVLLEQAGCHKEIK